MYLRRGLGDGTRGRGGSSTQFNPLGGLPHSRGRRAWTLEDCGGGASRLGALLGNLVDEGEDLRCIPSLFWLLSSCFNRLV